ncbi:hypothetical protein SRB5_15610 [Streptomyces sp. RB5]|uniref:Uncharacterized protein n=1 Tax=Streptomyces smaragdinus TaxID=2585196 RepID=A0A7K0CDL5_9ACTN|nr:hypothetical protein [Streptomyces smaragdinus]MQY11443.1 hypothetical protein [Streptomyces smaragdinus]
MPYDWPPLTPGNTEEVARRVARVLEDAWQRLADRQRFLLDAVAFSPQAPQVAAQLEDFKAAIADFALRAGSEIRGFVQQQLPWLYQAGATQAAAALGQRFTWSLLHVEALQSLAADTYADFLRCSQEQQRIANALYRAVREAARREVPQLGAGYTTGRQAAKALADRLATDHQLTHVVYRNGARVPVRAWAEAATLTKSAVAYNAGTLNRSREAGVTVVEVFDSADCGWTSHQDPDKANRTLRGVEEAAEWPISHPRCRRGFGPRPDVTEI